MARPTTSTIEPDTYREEIRAAKRGLDAYNASCPKDHVMIETNVDLIAHHDGLPVAAGVDDDLHRCSCCGWWRECTCVFNDTLAASIACTTALTHLHDTCN